MSKMHADTFGGRAPPGPAAGAYAPPDSLTDMGAYF